MKLLLGTQERVRNNHGKRAISVPAIEVLLYFHKEQTVTTFEDFVALGNGKEITFDVPFVNMALKRGGVSSKPCKLS